MKTDTPNSRLATACPVAAPLAILYSVRFLRDAPSSSPRKVYRPLRLAVSPRRELLVKPDGPVEAVLSALHIDRAGCVNLDVAVFQPDVCATRSQQDLLFRHAFDRLCRRDEFDGLL